jgi:hypothetical protein
MIPVAETDGAITVQSDGGAACGPNEKRNCSIDRGTFMGIHDCAAGTQYCEDGRWGVCIPN